MPTPMCGRRSMCDGRRCNPADAGGDGDHLGRPGPLLLAARSSLPACVAATVGDCPCSECRQAVSRPTNRARHEGAIPVVGRTRRAAAAVLRFRLLVTGVILGEEGLATPVCRKEVVRWQKAL